VSALVWLALPVLVGVTIMAFVAFRSGRLRRPGSIEEEMRQFRRGLDALDPANDPMRRRDNGPDAKKGPVATKGPRTPSGR
jgi:hypothetical protein